ncbi:hypothetical protein H4N49_01235 [Streptomyces sp. DHE17-7]|nr:hypothetical protein [Streptomyces sp. DHE17-7]
MKSNIGHTQSAAGVDGSSVVQFRRNCRAAWPPDDPSSP